MRKITTKELMSIKEAIELGLIAKCPQCGSFCVFSWKLGKQCHDCDYSWEVKCVGVEDVK